MIKFNNLSSKDSKFDAKLVWKEHIDQEKHASYRYSVTANFDFRPLADNYPFDWQHIYISFSISDQDQYGIIQPVPDELIDKDFKVDGWKLIESVSGVLRKQTSTNKGTKLLRKASVVSEARVGWTLARTNSVTVMKVGIPLSFLLFLTYYSLYSGFENFTISIGVLTTCFLSGIALYFSTERPQPLRMTTIDLIFLWYYPKFRKYCPYGRPN